MTVHRRTETEAGEVIQHDKVQSAHRGGLRFSPALVIAGAFLVGATILFMAEVRQDVTNPEVISRLAVPTAPAGSLRLPVAPTVEPTPVMSTEDLLRAYLASQKPVGFKGDYEVVRFIVKFGEPVQIVGREQGSRVNIVNDPFGAIDENRKITLSKREPINGKGIVQSHYVVFTNPETHKVEEIFILLDGENDPTAPGGKKPRFAVAYLNEVWTIDFGTDGGTFKGEDLFPETKKLATTSA